MLKLKIVAGALAVALAIGGVASAKPVSKETQEQVELLLRGRAKAETHAGYCQTTCTGYGGYRTCNTYCY